MPTFTGSVYYEPLKKSLDYVVHYRYSLIGQHFTADWYMDGRFLTRDIGTTVWTGLRFPFRRHIERLIRDDAQLFSTAGLLERYELNRSGPD